MVQVMPLPVPYEVTCPHYRNGINSYLQLTALLKNSKYFYALMLLLWQHDSVLPALLVSADNYRRMHCVNRGQ